MTDLCGLKWDGDSLEFLEQTLLPHEEVRIRTEDWCVVVDAIKRLAIRGAPAIGVAAACAVVLAKRSSKSVQEFEQALVAIEQARPTAVNLAWAVSRMRGVCRQGMDEISCLAALRREARLIAEQDAEKCERIAAHGLKLVPRDATVLTHCNTGALVTYGIGTALGVIRKAWETGKLRHVYACEARPLGQGARLTMWELNRLGIPGTLLCDSAVGRLFQTRPVDLVILGADRIAANGDTANKVGTFQLAMLARHFAVPFHVAAPSCTFDLSLPDGTRIPVEERDADEVRTCGGRLITVPDAGAFNPAFDITPAELITAFIREDGVFNPPCEFPRAMP